MYNHFSIIGGIVFVSLLLVTGILAGLYRVFYLVWGDLSPLNAISFPPKSSAAKIFKGLILTGGVSGGVAWGISQSVAWEGFGALWGTGGGVIMGVISGIITEIYELKRTSKDIQHWRVSIEIIEVMIGLLTGWLGGILCGAAGDAMMNHMDEQAGGMLVTSGVLTFAAIISINTVIVPIISVLEAIISWTVFRLLVPPFILTRFSTIVCNHCLRSTTPLQASYEAGVRYCEHCGKEVELTKIPGTVRIVFGEFPEMIFQEKPPQPFQHKPQHPLSPLSLGAALPPHWRTEPHLDQFLFPFQSVLRIASERVFVLLNPDFDQSVLWSMEVSEVYIDAHTSEPRLLERFLTFIVNYPPQQGIRTVKIFYKGELDYLGINLKNSLHNNFAILHQVA